MNPENNIAFSSWQRNSNNTLEREGKGLLGQDVVELRYNDQTIGVFQRAEYFPNRLNPKVVRLSEAVAGSLLEFSRQRQLVRFLNSGQSILTEYRMESDGDLGIYILPFKSSIEEQHNSWDSLLTLNYEDDELVYCLAQAESPVKVGENKDPHSNWKINLGLLKNLILHPDPKAEQSIEELVETSKDAYKDYKNSEGEELINTVEQKVDEAISKISTDIADVSYLEDFLAKSEFRIFTINELVRMISSSEIDISGLKEMDCEEILSQMIDSYLNVLTTSGRLDQEFLSVISVESFRESEFEWAELAVEVNSNVASYDLETVSSHNISEYGQRVDIKDNRFVFTKNSDEIGTLCFSDRGVRRWDASFPLIGSILEVIERIKDVNLDPGKIMQILPVSFNPAK